MRRTFLAIPLLLAGCATPYGDAGFQGGAVETQISEDRFSIRTGINGYSPSGLLKPLMLRRARQLGKERGYDSFVIESAEMEYFNPGMSYRVQTVVRFSKQRLIPVPGVVYAVNVADPYRSSMDSGDAARFAKLAGGVKDDEQGWRLVLNPVFQDAVATTYYNRESFLAPGVHRFFVHYVFNRRAALGGLGGIRHGFVHIQRPLEAKSYVMAGSYKDGVIEFWLEEHETKTRAGPSEFISLKDGN